MELGIAVGGAFLSSALNVFFDRMTPKFPNLFRGHKGDEQLLRKLKRTLRVVNAVLNDAEDKQITNRDVKEWLCELKDTVYCAEDLVDEINTEVLRLEAKGGEQSLTNRVSHLSNQFLEEIIPKIEEVVTTLEESVSQINVLGLKRNDEKKEKSHRVPSTSSVDESIYGRDSERDKLIQVVLSDDYNGNKVSVIPIVGMGGIGKTTLAQVVYGDDDVQKYFGKRAWVCVSQNYDTIKIIKTLVEEVTGSNSEGKDNLNMLEEELKKSLAKKRFLIVLDDVWNENPNDWDKLRIIFKIGEKGSKIIVTTRNEDVARMMQTDRFHLLEPISDDVCWSLFKKHAFGNGGSFASPEFEKIGKEIVKKCKGLPLAVKTLGGLLRSKTEVSEWDDILRSEFWKLNDVLPSLRLSYVHLPPHLKHCFAFCAIFPKNYYFNKEELVLLWMANDILQRSTQKDKTIEDLGREYFRELTSRCFFQKVNHNKYSMHDLVNDLAKSVSEKFCVRYEDYSHGEIPSEAQHFSYVISNCDAYEKFKVLAQVKSLRTFFHVNLNSWLDFKLTKMFLSDILPTLRCLRTLSFCGYDIKELPESICNLKLLRYVNLSWTQIKQLPDSICGLYNLQILLLSRCKYLGKLPMELTKLVNLRHLDLKETELKEMPSHISRLKDLQTLSCFVVGNSPGRSIKELEKLNLQGYLKIMGLQNVKSCKDANLRNKNRLEDLVLQWNGDANDSHIAKDTLDKLQPHTNLKSLTIDGYDGTKFSDWLSDDSFRNIMSMHLTNCKNCSSVSVLGHLTSLKSLVISGLGSIEKVDEKFYGDHSLIKPFNSLVTLRIKQMFQLKEWVIPEHVEFSHLEELYIEECPKLIGKLPSQLLCLKTLEISKCPQLVFPADWMSIFEVGLCAHLPSLRVLRISDMSNLKESTEELLRLEELKVQKCQVSSPRVMAHVNKMVLYNCPSLVSLPIVGPSANIKELYIENCPSFVSLPIVGPFANIKELRIENCPKFEFANPGDSLYDTSLGLFPKLQTLGLYECESLKIFPAPPGIQTLTLLRRLEINSCDNLLSFPRGGLQAPNLEYFNVWGSKKLKSLPKQMHSLLPSLRELGISNCPEIECFPEGGLPSSPEDLLIGNCKKPMMRCPREWGLQRLPALTTFIIIGDEESFSNEWLLPSSLRDFQIRNNKKLKTLNEKGLLRLTSFQTLTIYDCPELLSLSEKGLLTSLQTLYIWICPNLKSLPKEGLPTSLQTLEIFECRNLVSLPEEGLPTFLQTLKIAQCPNLESLPKEGLPTSLQTLVISSCHQFLSLPEKGLPTSLQTLKIPELSQSRVIAKRGPAHLPF